MNPSPKPVIALVGFMGSGKTTIGKILAERLRRDFLDLDLRIEESSGMTIPDLFRNYGEAAFRRLESEALASVVAKGEAIVLACGGGVVENPGNRTILTHQCSAIWLDVPKEELIRRLKDDFSGRPMLSGDLDAKVAMLMDRRYSLYVSVASIRHSWKEGETPIATVGEIMALLGAKADRSL